jgi:hypothetical protein
VRPGFARCYQCDRHLAAGGRLLADAVVPISYAVKGTPFAEGLWRYKSRLGPDPSAQGSLLALLLVFLSDHGPCVWRHAGMPVPLQLAVVPAGSGRPGPHPLLGLLSPALRLPVCSLALRPGRQGRDFDPGRFAVTGARPGAGVLLVDDTWVSGASAQSAAAALKRAGIGPVAVVIAGRHLNPGDPLSRPLVTALSPDRYDPYRCAVHSRPKHLMPAVKAERTLRSEFTGSG